jgi:ankyrin repeat protein
VGDRGQTPLAGAAFKGDRAIVDLLVAGGAPVKQAMAGGKTALMFAAMFDHVHVLERLLALGAVAEQQDDAGVSAAGLAQMMGAEGCAARLTAPELAVAH